jgi:hypothetical protein
MQSKNIVLSLLYGFGLVSLSGPASTTTLSIQPVTGNVQQGQTGGSLDVLLANNTNAAVTVAGFSFELTTSNTGVSFTDVNTSTVFAPYVFGGGDSFFGPDLTPGNPLSTTIDVVDLSLSGTGTVLDPGNSVSLGHVIFDVSGNAAPGPFTVSFSGGAAFNNLSDPNADSILLDATADAQITILGAAVPEPNALFMLLLGTAFVSTVGWLRQRVQSNHAE